MDDRDEHPIPEPTRRAWQKTVDLMADVLRVPATAIARVTDDGVEIVVAGRTSGNPYATDERLEPGAAELWRAAASASAPLRVTSFETDAQWRELGAALGMASALAMPLRWPSGSVFGAIGLMGRRESQETARTERLLEQFQELVEMHLALLAQQATLRERWRRDALTGALARGEFFDLGRQELKRARRYGEPMALVLLDFDGFDAVNDRFGHAAGDRVLRIVTRLAQDSLRESDGYFRLGGEEFVVLLPHTELDNAVRIAERLRALIEHKPVELADGEVACTVSMGVSGLEGAGESLDDLLAKADKALRAAKRDGRNRVEVHRRLEGSGA